MTEPIIPYATPARRGLTARDLFGVIVRTLGLGFITWSLYCWVYLVTMLVYNAPSQGVGPDTYVVVALFFTVLGLALLKGEWVVWIAYGRAPHHHSDSVSS